MKLKKIGLSMVIILLFSTTSFAYKYQECDRGLSYYDALTGEDGTLAPFALECQRRENGGISVGGTRIRLYKPLSTFI